MYVCNYIVEISVKCKKKTCSLNSCNCQPRDRTGAGMIVKTFSDIRIRAFLEGKQAELDKGEVCVVAIRGGAENYKVGWHPNVLQLCFDDDYPFGPVTDQQIKEWRSVLFSEEHAAKVQDFFAHVQELKHCRVLAVNCSKGTSRSGAIAAYAATSLLSRVIFSTGITVTFYLTHGYYGNWGWS